ncbi:protein kinase c and casein kinase substrate in neurons protein 1-like protein [Lasius niger]|uniref:Protein kinase c and casein kinase substrate in neurons protein 1-like protein n=1 Tax=Lasius niger TaxID=67767 RepID=A0A0J7KD89_LASNI|nr:protein kinase c and casein kinase substrate in neurons protein 1-like protein [Lasius niger]
MNINPPRTMNQKGINVNYKIDSGSVQSSGKIFESCQQYQEKQTAAIKGVIPENLTKDRGKPKIVQNLIGRFITMSGKQKRRDLTKSSTPRDHEFSLDLTKEMPPEEMFGQGNHAENHFKEEVVRSSSKRSNEEINDNGSTYGDSPITTKKRRGRIVYTDEEDDDKENSAYTDHINAKPMRQKVHTEFRLNSMQTLEGRMRPFAPVYHKRGDKPIDKETRI